MNPLVSVIIPVCNVEEYLPQCLDSVLNQTYRNLEVLATDDGSRDGSFRVLQQYAACDSRIRCRRQSNAGVSATRNRALAEARGEYVLFVDADDWIDETTVACCVEQLRQHGADACLFAYRREFANRSEPRFLFEGDRVFDEKGCALLQQRMIGPVGAELARPETLDSLGTIWGKLYRRAALEGIRFADLSLIGTAEDSLFNCFAFRHIRKAVYLNRALYHYRKANAGAETKRYKPELARLWDNLSAQMAQTASTAGARQALQNRVALSIIGLGLNECASRQPLRMKKRRIAELLNRPQYRQACGQLDFSYFPPHWKLFFFCAKRRLAWGLLGLLLCINKIINR